MSEKKDLQDAQDLLDIETLARLAGLVQTLEQFPEDVHTAARTALNVRRLFQPCADNTAELWPVMQVKS